MAHGVLTVAWHLARMALATTLSSICPSNSFCSVDSFVSNNQVFTKTSLCWEKIKASALNSSHTTAAEQKNRDDISAGFLSSPGLTHEHSDTWPLLLSSRTLNQRQRRELFMAADYKAALVLSALITALLHPITLHFWTKPVAGHHKGLQCQRGHSFSPVFMVLSFFIQSHQSIPIPNCCLRETVCARRTRIIRYSRAHGVLLQEQNGRYWAGTAQNRWFLSTFYLFRVTFDTLSLCFALRLMSSDDKKIHICVIRHETEISFYPFHVCRTCERTVTIETKALQWMRYY